MSAKDTLGNAPGLKEHEAKQNRVAHSSPNRPDGIAACCDALNEHRVNCNTYEDQQPLKAHGKRLGATLGFPTVNLRFAPGVLVPAYGVYATKVYFENGESRPAVTNIGVRPTVDDGDKVTVEGFILDFDGDLYGQRIRMEFYRHLRGEKRFSTLEELRAEVMRNAQQTRDYFEAKR